MKNLIAFLLFATLSGCGSFTTGEGSFNGRIIDVHWEGLIFKSCEVNFTLGQQSSGTSEGSTRSKELCDALTAQIGQVVTVKYQTWARPCCLRMDSPYELLP